MPNAAMPSNRVALASGMVAEQAGCSVDAALLLLNQRARSTDCTLDELAEMVIDRNIDFK
jgi:AmiR/NasT family two-component response regulator